MYVYRCTLYTTLQNPGWKRKAGYSQSAVSAHFLRACGHYLCMISCLLEDESRVLPGLRKRGVASATKNGVLPRLRKGGVAPRSRYMCTYIHLVRGCCPGSARGVWLLLEIYVYIYIYLVSILINCQPLFFFYIPLEDIHIGQPICHISTSAP